MRCFLLLPFLLLSACDGGKTPADDSTPVDEGDQPGPTLELGLSPAPLTGFSGDIQL
jgi:hypothetical protein